MLGVPRSSTGGPSGPCLGKGGTSAYLVMLSSRQGCRDWESPVSTLRGREVKQVVSTLPARAALKASTGSRGADRMGWCVSVTSPEGSFRIPQ